MNEISLGVKTKLPTAYLWYALTRMILLFILLSLPFSFMHFGTGMFFTLLIFLGIPISIIILINYKYTSFILEKDKIIISWGWLMKKSSSIPFSNVQNVETSSGPIARMFGITKISVWTASPSQMNIKGGTSDNKPNQFLYLKNENAEFLKDYILAK